MRAVTVKCAGCSQHFKGAAGELWCSDCKGTVAPFTVDLSADQRQLLESLAVVRGVAPAEVLRQGIASLAGRKRGKRPTPEQLADDEWARRERQKRK